MMKLTLPVVRGIIDRRMLINFRVAPDAIQPLVPEPFRLKRINGWAIAGICLIRLKEMRLPFVPRQCGLKSENAAHRIAVEWEQDGRLREGVFIPRRDSSARFQKWFGGKFFPGVHNLADFQVKEEAAELRLEMRSLDGAANILVEAREATQLPVTSVFRSLKEASAFFERGALGYSVTRKSGEFEGLELHSLAWRVTPLDVRRVESSFFGDRKRFPDGTVEFDSALLMRGIEHEWHARETLRADCRCVV